MSLYDALGGENGIRQAVDNFYERVTADPELTHYFANVDMARLRRHQRAMLAAATGGPDQYKGRDMATAHAGLGITSEHFDSVVAHLVDTLRDLGVEEKTISQVGETLAPLKGDIVTA
jgi:hemoglobin